MRGTCTPRRCSKARHITKQRQLQHVGVPPPRLWTLLLQLQHARSCKSEDSFWPRATSRAAGQSSLNCRQWCTDTLHQSAVSAGSATALQIRRFAVPQPRCISLARPHADCNTTTMTSHGDWLRNDLPTESRMLACVLLAHHAQHVAQRSPVHPSKCCMVLLKRTSGLSDRQLLHCHAKGVRPCIAENCSYANTQMSRNTTMLTCTAQQSQWRHSSLQLECKTCLARARHSNGRPKKLDSATHILE